VHAEVKIKCYGNGTIIMMESTTRLDERNVREGGKKTAA
jgi:hypothetical protein